MGASVNSGGCCNQSKACVKGWAYMRQRWGIEIGRAGPKSKDKRKVPGGTGYEQWWRGPSCLDTGGRGHSPVHVWIRGWCHLESEQIHI